MKKKKLGAGIWGVGVAAFLFALCSFAFIGYVAGRYGWTSEKTAAWIQSLGAITAIFVAFAVVNFDRWLQTNQAYEDNHEQQLRRLQHAAAVAKDSVEAIRESGRVFMGSGWVIDTHSVRLEDCQHMLRRLLEVPIEHAVDQSLLLLLRDTSRCIQDLRQFDRLFPVNEPDQLVDIDRFKKLPEERVKQYTERVDRVEKQQSAIERVALTFAF
ncbi:hypothetical protein RBI22_15370 [Alcaligenaceae bacterium C4P045]|nr:hypothetical protein [Alcaligenaceae bacterium C4P045]